MAILNKLELLPEENWRVCEKCGNRVPEFVSMPEQLSAEVEELLKIKKSPIGVIRRLREYGCSFASAQTWLHHFANYCQPTCDVLCAQCGKPLRTPEAKQCRFCHADWH